MSSVGNYFAKLFWLCAKLNLPRTAALLAAAVIRDLQGGRRRADLVVLVLPKDGFTQDVMTVLSPIAEIEILGLPRIVLREIWSAYLPFFVDDNNYASSGPEFDEAKRRYRAFLVTMFGSLKKRVPFSAIISGNFGYARERELATAATELGIPFIVLHKENLKTPGRAAVFERVYRERRGPFGGAKILVYNEVEKELQEISGVAKASAIEVVGMPRLDVIHAWRRQNAGTFVSKRILFFMFSPLAGMPRIPRKTAVRGRVRLEEASSSEDISLAQLCRGTFAALLSIARERPDISIAVKTKGRTRDLDDLLHSFDIASINDLPPNIAVVHGGDVLPMLAEASVVCGFNSTALLEAIAAGKPVVLPWFAEARSEAVMPFVLDLRPATEVAESSDALTQKLVALAERPLAVTSELLPAQVALLQRWTGNGDGKSADRARRAILSALGLGANRSAAKITPHSR